MKEIIAWIISLLMSLCIGGAPSAEPAIDCGMCGAHVHEWHYVMSVDYEPVAVCGECYELYCGALDE